MNQQTQTGLNDRIRFVSAGKRQDISWSATGHVMVAVDAGRSGMDQSWTNDGRLSAHIPAPPCDEVHWNGLRVTGDAMAALLLGRLELRHDGEPIDLGDPLQQLMLVVLLL